MYVHQRIASFDFLALAHIYFCHASRQFARDAYLGGVGLSLHRVGHGLDGQESYYRQRGHTGQYQHHGQHKPFLTLGCRFVIVMFQRVLLPHGIHSLFHNRVSFSICF